MESYIELMIYLGITIGIVCLFIAILRFVLGTSTMIKQNDEIIRLLKKIGGER